MRAPGSARVLDDFDARPGSTASLLRTIIGLYLRRIGGWISASDLVSLAGELDIAPAHARTAIARLKQKGMLLSERDGAIGYRLNPAAVEMLERGDRRIFDVRLMQPGDPWCLVSFSVPESRRDVRHRLRRRLQWLGCGTVSPALWICPAHLHDEVEDVFTDLGIREMAVLFRTETPQPAASLTEAVATWWDLGALRTEHELFQSATAQLGAPASESEAFAQYVRLIDSWRVLPYVDPGLPEELLPADWPGQRSFARFARLAALLEPAAERFVSAQTAGVVTSRG